jgi:AcrR family transcriptional regulator
MFRFQTMSDDRPQQILDAAAQVIIRQGYDKTTMSDIADEAGVSRGTVYLHFKGKEEIFDALIRHEVLQYMDSWLQHIEADPRGGTIGGIYRAVLYAINSRPLMAAVMRRDRRVMGSYLRKPSSPFASMQSASLATGFLQALQDAGTVRKDVDAAVMSHIMDMLAYGLITINDFRQPDEIPDYEVVMETIASMLDRLLTPENGGDNEAGKAVIRELAAKAKAQFPQLTEEPHA